jgi:peptidoglycan/LPS O-acetylase OafA/YrhL
MVIKVPTYGSNTALWSLGFEFWMYILAPLVIIAVFFRKKSRWFVVFGLLAVAIAFFIGPRAVGYIPLWALGAGVAAITPRIVERMNAWPVRGIVAARMITGGVTLAACLAVRGMNSLSEMAGGIIVAIPTAAFIATLSTGLIGSGFIARSLTKFSTLAHSSYSLYAIHTPIVVLVVSALGVGVDRRWPSDPLHWGYMLLIIAGMVAVAWLFAQGTERHTSAVRKFIMGRIGHVRALNDVVDGVDSIYVACQSGKVGERPVRCRQCCRLVAPVRGDASPYCPDHKLNDPQ